ncbi:alpha/beta-hydrolase [Polyplosphaeria fusca]|uniref:Carboxylic ester hydrolase n=1 Tax=Polyplosphaeria fusca TaxID=682080 RepID=A0A9P4R9C2_9PLEO|nr:alpha/beta-hydrolase [Polyplosphaeria fusca]
MRFTTITALGLARLAWGDSTQHADPTAQTSSGLISGQRAAAAPKVMEYLGIPFAKPPLDQLRFAPPEPFTSDSSINATSFGYSCPISSTATDLLLPRPDPRINFTAAGTQMFTILSQSGDRFSEDCLTLNIWTKAQQSEEKKAVMVYFYGGGFVIGNSDAPTYNGAHFVDQEDVVMVTINYRLNIFGYPGHPGAANLGLLDQRLAVEWVRDNIAAFGGDSSRITIFGESAGGASVDVYSYAWPSDPIVSGLIAQSGTVIPPSNASTAAALWSRAATALGCSSTSNTTAELACMRKQPASALSEVISKLPNFTPYADNRTVPTDYASRSAAGNFAKVPLLIGHNDNEASMLAIVSLLKTNTTLPDAFWHTYNLDLFFCPVARRAAVSSSHNLPVWRYRYFGDFPNLRVSADLEMGSSHGAELFVLFDNMPAGVGIPASTDEQVEFGRYMRRAWAAFARDPQGGLEREMRWPRYRPEEATLVRLGLGNRVGLNLGVPEDYDGECD